MLDDLPLFRSFFLRKSVHILRVRVLAAEDPYFGQLLTPLHSQFAYFSPSYFCKKNQVKVSAGPLKSNL